MAKTTGPLFSLTASGKLASTIVYAIWKGIPYVRQLVIPANPQSVGQQTPRAKLGSAGAFNAFIEPTSDAQVELNSLAPSGQSGVSYFAAQQISRYAQSATDYADVGNATVAGYFDDGAVTLGLQDVTIPGATPLVVAAGQILWNAYDSMFYLDATLAPSAAIDATAANVTTFLAALAAA